MVEQSTDLEVFNALSEEDAKKFLAEAEGQTADFRSCWYCNGAHAHLKNRALLQCFECGNFYLHGYPAPVVISRSKGRRVTAEEVAMLALGEDDD